VKHIPRVDGEVRFYSGSCCEAYFTSSSDISLTNLSSEKPGVLPERILIATLTPTLFLVFLAPMAYTGMYP